MYLESSRDAGCTLPAMLRMSVIGDAAASAVRIGESHRRGARRFILRLFIKTVMRLVAPQRPCLRFNTGACS